MSETKEMKIKEWFLNKTQDTAARYNMWIDFKRNEDGRMLVEDGFVTVVGEVENETEKAVKVRLSTGDVVGSGKGWSTWIPKSVMA